MTQTPSTVPVTLIGMSAAPDPDGYVPGVCNIGSYEIRRRRAIGIAGFATALLVLAGLVAVDAPAAARLLVFPLLAAGFNGWLQARRRFCVGFAVAGLVNLDRVASGRRAVIDPAALRADRTAALRLVRDSMLLALPIAVIAVLLPL